MEMTVGGPRMTADGRSIPTGRGYPADAEATHAQPDSRERIADEPEEWKEDSRVDGSGDVSFRAGDPADRIRRPAEKEGRRWATRFRAFRGRRATGPFRTG